MDLLNPGAELLQQKFGKDINVSTIKSALAGFAAQLGIGEFQTADGLADVLPGLVDKGSSGGSLLDNAGGIKGVPGFAKKSFRTPVF